jgi:hypothetical protein
MSTVFHENRLSPRWTPPPVKTGIILTVGKQNKTFLLTENVGLSDTSNSQKKETHLVERPR